MTSLLMSYPPIGISYRLFRCRYSNSGDVVASSPSFSRPAARAPPRKRLQNQKKELEKGKKKDGGLLQQRIQKHMKDMYTCKIDQPYIPALLGKTKGKVFKFVFKCLKVSRICFKELIHSFILITQETPKTNVFVIRPRAEAAKWVFRYRGMSCRMAFESKLKDK